jgi:hypothetical protein
LSVSHGFGGTRRFNPQDGRTSQGKNQPEAGRKQSYVIKYVKDVQNVGLNIHLHLRSGLIQYTQHMMLL